MYLLVIARELWWTNQERLENQMGTHKRPELVAVQRSPYALNPQGQRYSAQSTVSTHANSAKSSDDGRNNYLRNVGQVLGDYAAQHARRQSSSGEALCIEFSRPTVHLTRALFHSNGPQTAVLVFPRCLHTFQNLLRLLHAYDGSSWGIPAH
jgi:hypothetical protein